MNNKLLIEYSFDRKNEMDYKAFKEMFDKASKQNKKNKWLLDQIVDYPSIIK